MPVFESLTLNIQLFSIQRSTFSIACGCHTYFTTEAILPTQLPSFERNAVG